MANLDVVALEVKDENQSAFRTIMAIFIAVVTVVGALIAWRASILSEVAADADFAGITAIINREEALTVGTSRGYERYRAYTDYMINQTILNELESADQSAIFEDARVASNNSMANSRQYFEINYLKRDGSYDLERDMATHFADASLKNTLDPESFYAEAEQVRGWVQALVADFLMLALALLCFTIAEALHESRTILRYTFASLGVLALTGGILVALMLEVA